ncbi:hypothetical protein JW752_02770 [Candidatus Peregrinibacteria bacterium]|nr:hypothetical protein [Candidatus Peregrinibacteria bacterium]
MKSSKETLQDFDLEQWRDELAEKTAQYADLSINWGAFRNRKKTEQKDDRAKKLEKELIDMCAEALLLSSKKKTVMKEIFRIVIHYRHPKGEVLFPAARGTGFLERLILKLVSMAGKTPKREKVAREKIAAIMAIVEN